MILFFNDMMDAGIITLLTIIIFFINTLLSYSNLQRIINSSGLPCSDTKFIINSNRRFIVFFSVLFFTCLTGMFNISNKFIGDHTVIYILGLFCLYFIFLFGAIISIHKCFNIYRYSARLSAIDGSLSNELKQFISQNPTEIDSFILSSKGVLIEATVISVIWFLFLIVLRESYLIS